MSANLKAPHPAAVAITIDMLYISMVKMRTHCVDSPDKALLKSFSHRGTGRARAVQAVRRSNYPLQNHTLRHIFSIDQRQRTPFRVSILMLYPSAVEVFGHTGMRCPLTICSRSATLIANTLLFDLSKAGPPLLPPQIST